MLADKIEVRHEVNTLFMTNLYMNGRLQNEQ